MILILILRYEFIPRLLLYHLPYILCYICIDLRIINIVIMIHRVVRL